MSKFTIKEQVKQMAPYFFLAVAVILVFRISGEIGMFWGFLATAWGVISPFLYGFLLAYIMNIPASSIQRLLARSQIAFFRRRQKALSIVAVLLILIGLVAIMLSFVIPAVIDSINLFIENIPTYWESIVALIDNINQFGLFDIEINPETIFGFIGGLF
ncbi:MAG: hypothetical protein FWB71_06860, partial [Defluviitaleaceae bacterium]|nr:hypothetical protein [Defluviitaleaceae bacterium]